MLSLDSYTPERKSKTPDGDLVLEYNNTELTEDVVRELMNLVFAEEGLVQFQETEWNILDLEIEGTQMVLVLSQA